MNRSVQTLLCATLLLAGFGGVARAGALPDGKQDAEAPASQSQSLTLPPLTTPAKITYEAGQLTIIAENSMLSDVMNTLHTLLKADIDLPASASSERVWVRLGPGPARKVLSDLLSGTDLNFVIQGSATDADGIRSVVLTPHTDATSSGAGGNSIDAPERTAIRRFPQSRREAIEASQPDNPAPAETSATPVTPVAPANPATPPAADGTPATTPSVPAANAAPPAGGDAGSISAASEIVAHPSPPEAPNQQNMSQQLLSMYQQRRQLNQQGVQPPPIQTVPPQ